MGVDIYQVLGQVRKYDKDKQLYEPSYKAVNYRVVDSSDGNSEEVYCKRLSSEALYEYYRKNGHDIDEIVLLKPKSLEEDDETIIEYTVIDDDVKDRVRIKPIQSIGRYGGKYRSMPTDISFQIFTDMITVAGEPDKITDHKIIIDLSTGYNLYVVALMEAARYFITYSRLHRCDTNAETPVRYAVSEPVGVDTGSNDSKSIFVYDYEARTTFDLPEMVKLTDVINADGELKKRIGNELNKYNNRMTRIFSDLKLVYNALYHNAPLFLFSYRDIQRMTVDDLICMIVAKLNYIIENNIAYIDRKAYQIFLSLALYRGLMKMLDGKYVSTKGYATLSELEMFNEIYDKLGLSHNKRYLNQEIKRIKEHHNNLGEGWVPYRLIYNMKLANGATGNEDRYDSRKRTDSDIKRNFFAHAGLSYDTILLCKINNDILCKYITKMEKNEVLNGITSEEEKKIWGGIRTLEEIKEWIENPA